MEFFEDRSVASRVKHQLLMRYLPVFAMKTSVGMTERRAFYLDGYARPGLYDDSSPGSPLVAADVARYLRRTLSQVRSESSCDLVGVFIEEDAASAERLRENLTAVGRPDWTVLQGTSVERLGDAMDLMDIPMRGVPVERHCAADHPEVRVGLRVAGRTLPALPFADPGPRTTGQTGSTGQLRRSWLRETDGGPGSRPKQPTTALSGEAMENRYRSLRIVAIVLRVLAVIVAVLGGLFVITRGFGFVANLGAFDAFGSAPIAAGSIVGLIVGLVVVALYALFLWASGSMINLFIDLEKNTRATANFIADLNRNLTSPPS